MRLHGQPPRFVATFAFRGALGAVVVLPQRAGGNSADEAAGHRNIGRRGKNLLKTRGLKQTGHLE